MDPTEFLARYDGTSEEPARSHYVSLVHRVDADMQILDELDHRDRTLLLKEIAAALVVAERIGYRYQANERKPIYDGAIFVEDDSHYEDVLSPTGAVSYREDWKDSERPAVIGWLRTHYPDLGDYLDQAYED